ncbi:FAD-binding oxidoreductase [Methyloraptor flagellatus]|uniref:FAD-binding oxidoreductase n=1 Tax=Methyloraptor flagellatus TaxID=3162530 RepID=A0AAU7XES5_9HYPH
MSLPAPSSPETALIDALAAIVGTRHVLTEPQAMAPHLVEWRGLYRGTARAVVRPGSTAEVAAVMRLASERRVPVVPQGGNTGLVGGQIPFGDDQIVLSLGRLDRLRDVDPVTDTIVAEAGVTLQRLREAADGVDRLFPLSIAAEGSCTIGGNLATNAGGTAVLAYGNARDLVLGLEVVLADGRIWNGLGRLRKDNTGYDLKHLFVGSEGTLGVITAAVLKLFPKPRASATAFVAVPDPASAMRILERARGEAGGALTTFELMMRRAVEFVLSHGTGVRDPLADTAPWYVLIELTGQDEAALAERMEAILGAAIEAGEATDAALAASLDQARAFWRIRDLMSEVQAHEGGSIKHDIAVPLAAMPAFLDEAIAAVEALVPGCRPAAFGHAGDGNIHFNVSQPPGADKAAYIAGWEAMNAIVHAIATRLGGSISAEHGIGILKRDLLPEMKDPVGLDLMRTLKASLDPLGILNPGKVL